MRHLLVVLGLGLLVSGCARDLAILYIATEPPGAEVVSVDDGQHLDDGTGTPTEVLFHRANFPYSSDSIKLLIYKDCYRPDLRVVTIDRWYGSIDEARLNGNNVRPRLAAVANCINLHGQHVRRGALPAKSQDEVAKR
jgi:hypothetical protein